MNKNLPVRRYHHAFSGKRIALLLLFACLVSGVKAYSQEIDLEELRERYASHIVRHYLQPLRSKGKTENNTLTQSLIKQPVLSVKLLGYVLGQQLRFIEKNTPAHRLWIQLEQTVYSDISNLGITEGKRMYPGSDGVEIRNRLLVYTRAAVAGYFDEEIEEYMEFDGPIQESIFEDIDGYKEPSQPKEIAKGSGDLSSGEVKGTLYSGIWHCIVTKKDSTQVDDRTATLSTMEQPGAPGYRSYNVYGGYDFWNESAEGVTFFHASGRIALVAKAQSKSRLVGFDSDGWKYDFTRVQPSWSGRDPMPGVWIYTLGNMEHFQDVFSLAGQRYMGGEQVVSLIRRNENTSHFMDENSGQEFVLHMKGDTMELSGWYQGRIAWKKQFRKVSGTVYQDQNDPTAHLIKVIGAISLSSSAGKEKIEVLNNSEGADTGDVIDRASLITRTTHSMDRSGVEQTLIELQVAAVGNDQAAVAEMFTPELVNDVIPRMKRIFSPAGMDIFGVKIDAKLVSDAKYKVEDVRMSSDGREAMVAITLESLVTLKGNTVKMRYVDGRWKIADYSINKSAIGGKIVEKTLDFLGSFVK